MDKDDWRNVVSCMQDRAFSNMPHVEIVSDEHKRIYNECVETLVASYLLMDFYYD